MINSDYRGEKQHNSIIHHLKKNMKNRIFKSRISFALPPLSRKRLIFVLFVIIGLTAYSVNSILTLKINPKWSDALPRTDTLVDEYLTLVEDSLRGSLVYVIVEGIGKEKAADEFSYQVLELPNIGFVFDGRMKLTGNGFTIYSMDQSYLTEHLQVIKNINIDKLVNLFKVRLKRYISASIFVGGQDLPTDNLNNFLIDLTAALENKPPSSTDKLINDMFFTQGNRIRSHDNGALLILIGTNISEGSIDRIDELSVKLNLIRDNVLKNNSNSDIKLTGYPITARDEMQNISESGKKMTILTLFLVTIVLMIFYRNWKFVAGSVGILCIAIIWTLTLNVIFFRELNTITLIMGLVLIGVGIDFSIHWINYNNLKIVSSEYYKLTATPILAGAFTTAAAFLALLILNVKSITEFGIMSFLGIMIVAGLILLLMPNLRITTKDSAAYNFLRRSSIIIMPGIRTIHKKKVLIIAALLIAGCVILLPNLQYEYNYAKLQTGNLPSYGFKDEIKKKFGFSSDVFLNRTKGLENASEVKKKLMLSDEVGYVLSISDYVPVNDNLSLKNAVIEEILKESQLVKTKELDYRDLMQLKDDLMDIGQLFEFSDLDSSSLSEIKFNLMILSGLLNAENLKYLNSFNKIWVETFKSRINEITKNSPGIGNSSEVIRNLFHTSVKNEYIQYIYAANDTWEKHHIESIEPVLIESAPYAVGLSRISYHISRRIINDIIIIAIISLLIILVTLRLTQRTYLYAFLAMMPLCFGILITLSTLSLLNIKVSLYNLISLPIIMGIGIDDGLHVIHSYRENYVEGIDGAVYRIGPAIFLTSLTSMIGFGCLSFYTHPGISSLGIVTFIGIGWCFLTTIFLLPIIIDLFANKIKSNR